MQRVIYLIFCLIIFFASVDVQGVDKYQSADKRAYMVPRRLSSDLNALTDYLVQPFQQNELLKTRVIFAWIQYHIQYDYYEYNSDYEVRSNKTDKQCLRLYDNYYDCYKDGPFETFEKRAGVCRHFAKLFTYMAKRAKLDSVVIAGYNEGVPHAWNAVKIKSRWYLLDATSSKIIFNNIKTDFEYENEIEKRKRRIKGDFYKRPQKIDDRYFLADPQKMIKIYFPQKERWQLIDKPISAQSYLIKYPFLNKDAFFMDLLNKEKNKKK